ncbi:Hypothetical_protein [Hexamita inflata]|uniref:Hypothetical_protein n=1 Tax=Hexamita inflata TaxID=28002 RepID=A0AA86UU18_9EUKA|nr:Hypothetical protein HINF_LOCUS59415 [Hexamita inflata]
MLLNHQRSCITQLLVVIFGILNLANCQKVMNKFIKPGQLPDKYVYIQDIFTKAVISVLIPMHQFSIAKVEPGGIHFLIFFAAFKHEVHLVKQLTNFFDLYTHLFTVDIVKQRVKQEMMYNLSDIQTLKLVILALSIAQHALLNRIFSFVTNRTKSCLERRAGSSIVFSLSEKLSTGDCVGGVARRLTINLKWGFHVID